jgi:hypothetical protein
MCTIVWKIPYKVNLLYRNIVSTVSRIARLGLPAEVAGMEEQWGDAAVPAARRWAAGRVGEHRAVDAYTLVLASFLVLAGSTADRVGRRRIFQVGLAAFGLGSLLCGLAPGIGWLIAARALQAIGGTMLNPVAMAITANTFPAPAERARAIGVFGSMSGLSLALGPILGGVPARWSGSPAHWPPPDDKPALPWASRSPERSWDRPWPAAARPTPTRSTACGGSYSDSDSDSAS